MRPHNHINLCLSALALLLPLCMAACHTQPRPSIGKILAAHPDRFGFITNAASQYRLQIVLSEVIPASSSRGRPTLSRSTYRAGAEYFYPASAIKLCAAVAALQTIEGSSDSHPAQSGGITLDTPLTYHPVFADESPRTTDPSNRNGQTITIRHEIRKLFLVSDNEAFNRLYEFVGHRELNQRMRDLGLRSVVINHRLSVSRTADENRRTPRIDAAGDAGIITIPERTSDLMLVSADVPGLKVGSGFMASGEQLKLEPMDFSARNAISIADLQDLLVMLVRPDIQLPAGKGPLRLSENHRRFLLDAMAEYPGDSRNPVYPRIDFPDDWGKFFLPGLIPNHPKADLTIHNKVGQAYGFTIDNACITDHRSGRASFLTAVIYTNADGILNDDAYEYDSVALPFMANLAAAVAEALWRDGAPSHMDSCGIADPLQSP